MEARRKRHHAVGWTVVLAVLVVVVGVTASEAGRPRCGSFLVPRSTEGSIEQTDPSLASAAHEFQPTLAVARADRNWPVSIETVLHLQVGRHHTCRRSTGCVRVPEPGDLPRGGTEEDWLTYATPHSSPELQFADFGSAALGGCTTAVTLAQWLTRSEPLPVVSRRRPPLAAPQEYFFRSPALPGGAHPKDPKLQKLRKTAAYSLQYWFFYPFNYLPLLLRDPSRLGTNPAAATALNTDYHQGDFEHVDVLVDRPMRRVLGVYMARHSGENKTFLTGDPGLTFESDPKTGLATHPIVWAGIGGHASYESCGAQLRKALHFKVGKIDLGYIGLIDYAICPPGQSGLLPLANGPAGPVPGPEGPTFTFRQIRLVELEPNSWACWNGRFGVVPNPPGLTTYEKSSAAGILLQHQPGPKAPLTQDGSACNGPAAPATAAGSPLG